jgi:sugar phosphate isomerase/epimerase
MNLSVSNIAWTDDDAAAAMLKGHGIENIDVAPGKYFNDISSGIHHSEVFSVRDRWAERGFNIVGAQSLLYGTRGFNIFSSDETRKQMLEYLNNVCQVCTELNATRLTFGSPKNRDRSAITSDAEVRDIAAKFFRELGNIAVSQGVTICLEPNPTIYGCNFMTTTLETAAVVRAVGHSAIKLQLDLGAVTYNKEDLESVLNDCAGLVGHIHISEPNLVPLDLSSPHAQYGKILNRFFPDSIATVEMAVPPNVESLNHSVSFAKRLYL